MSRVLSLLALTLCTALIQLAIAADAPDFELKDLKGRKHSLSDLLDNCNLLVVAFWQVGCEPSNELLPHLQDYADKYAGYGVQVVVISRGTSLTQSQVEPFVKSHDYNFFVLLDLELEASKDYGVRSSPATFIITPEGEVVLCLYGYKAGQEAEIEQKIKDFLVGKRVEPVSPGGFEALVKADAKRATDATYLWKKYSAKCKIGSIYELDGEFARLGFEVSDEGMMETKHGSQPYHVWHGAESYHGRDFDILVRLAYGRGGYYWYWVWVDSAMWGELDPN
jgi:peroxiredoxin